MQAGYTLIDLSQRTAPEELLEEVEQNRGLPRILVNNAAHSIPDITYEELDADCLDAHYAVNLRATLLLSATFARRCPADGMAGLSKSLPANPGADAWGVGLCQYQGRH